MKKYVVNKISRFISGTVLEVGAGQGNNLFEFVASVNFTSWKSIEPDTVLFEKLKKNVMSLNMNIATSCGTIDSLSDESYDTIIYWDVLEHIEEDKLELEKVASFLNKGGKMIIIVPSWQFLYSDFDKSIGHNVRYNKKLLNSVIPNSLTNIDMIYLDSVGLLASLMNKVVLKQTLPTEKQIMFWDNKIIPFSKILYTPASYLWSTGNMVFLFDIMNISSVIFQSIQNNNDFQNVVNAHYKKFGEPLLFSKQGKTSKYIWETNTGNIILSHTVRPLGFTLQNMITETPHPGFAFIDLEGVNFATSMGIWKLLRENSIIDGTGIAINKDLDKNLSLLSTILEPIELSFVSLQTLKVMLLSTTYGETNILYLNKNNDFLLNSTEDEDFDIMLQ